MIVRDFYLKNYDNWHITFFIATNQYDADEILDRLEYIGCKPKFIRKAYRNLTSGRLNSGLTYTNPKLRESIIVISEVSDLGEFLDSFFHELDHFEKHVTQALGFSPYSEYASYLIGQTVKNLFYSFSKKHVKVNRTRRLYSS